MKVKKWLLGLITFAAMAVICAVCAGAERYGDFEYDVLGPGIFDGVDDYTIQITKYNGNDVSVDIPDSISGMSVAGIAEHAFYNCTSLKTVTIPANVISIGDEALGYYYDSTEGEVKKVDNFNINYVKNTWGHYYAVENGFSDETCLITKEDVDGFFYIRKYAGHCAAYEIPSEVDGKKITYISGSAFYGSTELTDIRIPDSITYIGNYAFFNCTSLKAVTIPASVKDIDVRAFGYYDDNGIDKKLDDFKINYIKNTGGHQYAAKNGFSDEPCLITEEQSDGTLEICGYAGNSTTYAIPSEVEGKKITVIGYDAFNGCTELTSVTIPDSITRIESRAFYDCASLETIAIPASVTEIYWQAFYNCTSLKEVTIPKSVTYIKDEAFGYYYTDSWEIKKVDGFKINYVKNTQGHLYATKNGFSDETCLTTYEHDDGTLAIVEYAGNDEIFVIPDEIDGKKVTGIDNAAFSDCTKLTSVTIPDGVTEIDWQAFYGCTSLETVIIPESVTSIDGRAFDDCTSLKSVTIPKSVTYIGDSAFGYYYDEDSAETKKVDGFKINYVKNTMGHLYAAKNGFTDESCLFVKENDNGTLTISGYCGNDRSYTIPSDINGRTITEIGYFAFENSEFTDIKIPDSIETIYGNAFINCANLKSVSIPAGVSLIDEYAFGYLCDDNSVYSKVEDFTLNYVKNTAGHLYAARNGFTDESCLAVNELYDGTLEISGYVGNDTEYVIPGEIDGKKVMQIRERAFFECNSLVNIKIPDSVVYIGANAFARCASLENIDLPNSLTYIGSGAFSYCTSLAKVELPDGVTNIGDSAFYNCSSITSIVIPENVEKIGMGAFFNCNQIKSVTIPASVKDVSYNAFGYVYGDNWQYVKSEDFKIYCYKGTAGEQYAKDNGFDYEILDSETQCTHSNTEIRNAVSADCTTEGYTGDTYCADCDELISSGEVIPATGHTEVIDKAVAATCTETGLTEGKHCSVCNTVIKAQEVVPATGHTEVTDKAVEATCTETGLTEGKHCSVCSTVIQAQEVVPAKGHTEVTDNAVEATCTKTGLTEGKHCSVCGAVIKAQETVPATGKHKFGDWKTTKAATYTATGTKTKTCKVCKKTETATIAKLTLAKVGGFKVKAKDSISITLQWNKNANASGYIIEAYNGKTWSQVTKIAKNSTLTYKVTKLSASKTYQYRIKAYKTEGKATAYSANSATLSVNTNPSGMSGYKIKSKTATSVTLQWNKNASATGYELQKWDGKKWVALTKITKNSTTTYTIKSLKASTTYKYKIRAYKTIGKATQYSGYTELSVNTNPTNMSGFKAKSKSYNSVTLQWNKNTSATGYELQKWDGKKWVALTKITKNSTTTYTVKSLKASTTYKYRIRAYKTIGKATQYSGYSATLSVNTNPSNMSGFMVKSKSYNSITLQWNKNTSATGYELQKWDGKKWVTLTKISKNSTTTYTVKSLKASTTYKYRIRAYKTIGKATQYSSYKELSVNTNPTNMSGFKAKTKTATSVTLQWNKNTSATGYELQKWDGKKWVTLTKISKNSTTTYTVKNLKAVTTYKFRIRAYKTIGKTTQYSAYSATLSANTIPTNVSRFRLNSKTGKMLNLGWDMSDDAAGYIVQQYKGGKWVQVAKLAKSKYSVRINDLSPSTTYKFRIRKYANIGKTTVYGNWSYKSFKTEGKNCVDEVKFTPRGEKIDAFVAAHMDEVWNESYFDKPKDVRNKSEWLNARYYPIPMYGEIQVQYWFADPLTIIGETDNGYYITSDNYYVYSEYVIESKDPPEPGTGIEPIPQY